MAASEGQDVRYYVKVVSGPDEGKISALTDGACLIGRSDDANLILSDPQAGFEHAEVSVSAGRVWVENLVASGTLVQGRPVTGRTPLASGDLVELTEQTRIRLEVHGPEPRRSSWVVPVCAIALLIVGGAMVIARLQRPPPARTTVRLANWQSAHVRVGRRMEQWVRKGLLARDVTELFDNAWLRERSGNDVKALALWQQLQAMMMTMHVPGAMPEGHTFASHAGRSPKSLYVIMGLDPGEDPDSFQWSSDEAIADAAWWLVSLRARQLGQRRQSNE